VRRQIAASACLQTIIEGADRGLFAVRTRQREDQPSLHRPVPGTRRPAPHLRFHARQELPGAFHFGKTAFGSGNPAQQPAQEIHGVAEQFVIRRFGKEVHGHRDLLIRTITRLREVRRRHQDPDMPGPGQKTEFGVLPGTPDAHGEHVPSQRVLHARLGRIRENARVNRAQPALPLEEEREILAVRLGVDLQETRQTVLVEQRRVEGVGRRQTTQRFAGVPGRTPHLEQNARAGSTAAHARSW
jgi:hypothetical protein